MHIIWKTQNPPRKRTSTLLGWLSSRYASRITGVGSFQTHFPQVLTGKTPFPDIKNRAAVGYHVLRGKRPEKPENASVIGFSDSLWVFTERCWGGKIVSRPKVREVVKCLGGAATRWKGLMPPCPVEDVTSGPGELTSSEKSSDLEVFL